MFVELKPFRFWCQKVLPLVYDDSLSYYELLCKVMKHLNIAIEDINELKEIITGGIDIQEEVDRKIDEMVLDGTMDKLVANAIQNDILAGGGDGEVYPSYDFSKLAEDVNKLYSGNLTEWNASFTIGKWAALVAENSQYMYRVNAYTESGITAPCYVWKARKNRQTTHEGESSENKFGSISYYYYGEKTFVFCCGETGNQKMDGAVVYHLFEEWLKGNYNGDYILDNYNFIILPIVNVLDYNNNTDSNPISHTYNNGFYGYGDSTSLNDKIETFMGSGIESILESIMGHTIQSYEKWRYNQKVVMFNLKEISWGHAPSYEPLDGYTTGMLVRGHYSRTYDAEKILFDSGMATFRKVVNTKPELYANGAFTQMHYGMHTRHGLPATALQNGYRSLNIEFQKYVGENYSDVASVPYTENSFFLAFTFLYNLVLNSMHYLNEKPKRVFSEITELGEFLYVPSINTIGDPVNPYRPVDIDELIKRVPPGSYASFATENLTYKDGNDDTQYVDLKSVYLHLPSKYAGELQIHKGGNEHGNDSSRGMAIYCPFREGSKYYYCKLYHDGTHSDWWSISGLVSMDFCVAGGTSGDVTTTANEITKIPVANSQHEWSSVEYFGVSNGGIHIRKHGLYLVSAGVQITAGSDVTRIATFVMQGAENVEFDETTAIAGGAIPDSASSFVGGVACDARIVEIPAERWLYIGCRTTGDSATVAKGGANTFLQALLIKELS